MIYHNLAIVDVETTGISGSRDRIIEIAILRIEKNKVIKKLDTLINPQAYVSPFIENLTGISAQSLLDAPVFGDVKKQVVELLEGVTFVAHNAHFDYSFISHELLRHKKQFLAPSLCTVKLSRSLFPRYKRHGMEAIINRYNLSYEKRHRAFDDAYALWQFLNIVKKEIEPKKLKNTWQSLITNHEPTVATAPISKNKTFYMLKKEGSSYTISSVKSINSLQYTGVIGIFMNKQSAQKHKTFIAKNKVKKLKKQT